MDGRIADDSQSILHLWKEHFQQLATPSVEENFNTEKLELIELQNNIIERMETGNGNGIDHVSANEVSKAIMKLKAGKAPDEDGIAAEHYKLATEELTPYIIHILNNIISYLDVPIFLKGGILTPVLKKDKDKTNPVNYRGITVTKIFAKILQSILKDRIDVRVNDIQNNLQRGFTEGVSSLCAAFITSEAVEESKELKQQLILVTLDAEKAFDRLNHEILFNKLYHYGIKGKLWVLLRNLYRGMNIKIKWEGQHSEKVDVRQGIQQGAKLSTSLYKCYNNVILDSIVKSGLGAYIGNIAVPAPTCADDIAVLANSVLETQGILDIVSHHTTRDLVKINPQKSDAVVYNKKGKPEIDLEFGDSFIKQVCETKHLGIKRNERNKVDISDRIRIGRATIYSLLGAGLHVRRGFSPVTAHKLWRIYAIPRCIYGLEIMNLTKKDLEMLELAQRKILRQLQGLPNNTSNTAVYVIIGAEPIEITIEKNLLTFFMNISRNKGLIEHEILCRQVIMSGQTRNDFMARLEKTLYKYSFRQCSDYLQQPVPKNEWKKMINQRTNQYWKETCETEKSGKSTLHYLQIQNQPLKQVHNVWKSVKHNISDVKAAEVKARILTQTYLVQSKRAKYDQKINPVCTLCRKEEENLDHFLLRCAQLESIRRKHLDKIKECINNVVDNRYERIERDGKLLQLILDCTSRKINCDVKEQELIESMTRAMCYELHLERSRKIRDEPGV